MPKPFGTDTEGNTGLLGVFFGNFFWYFSFFSNLRPPGFPFPAHLQLSKEMFLMKPCAGTLGFDPRDSKALGLCLGKFPWALLRTQDPNKHLGFCLPQEEREFCFRGVFGCGIAEGMMGIPLLVALPGCSGISGLGYAGNSGHTSG